MAQALVRRQRRDAARRGSGDVGPPSSRHVTEMELYDEATPQRGNAGFPTMLDGIPVPQVVELPPEIRKAIRQGKPVSYKVDRVPPTGTRTITETITDPGSPGIQLFIGEGNGRSDEREGIINAFFRWMTGFFVFAVGLGCAYVTAIVVLKVATSLAWIVFTLGLGGLVVWACFWAAKDILRG